VDAREMVSGPCLREPAVSWYRDPLRSVEEYS
jgi:hypothetical protein